MPAYVRLLVVLLQLHPAGVLPRHRCRLPAGAGAAPLFVWFPAIQAAVIAAVYFFRLEVAVGAEGSIYFTSGTSDDVCCASRRRCCCRWCS